VIILGTVEHHRLSLERIRVVRVRQIARPKIIGNDRCFHDGAVEQISFEVDEAGRGQHGVLDTADNIFVRNFDPGAVLSDRFAVGRLHIGIRQQSGTQQLPDNGGNAARMVVILAEIVTRRLKVYEQRNIETNRLPVIIVQGNAEVTGNGVQMYRRVRRSADCRIDDDGVFECLAGHDVAGFEVFPNHVDNPLAGGIGHLATLAVGRRNGGRPWQLHAQGFGQRIHRRGGAHRVAVTS